MAQQGIGRKCERLRYALGFVPEVYAGPPTGGLIARLKALWDNPGDHQDAVAATSRELGTATKGPHLPHGGAFPMGVYPERYRREPPNRAPERSSPHRFAPSTRARAGRASRRP